MKLNLSKLFNVLFKIQNWEIEQTRQVTDQEDYINLGETVFNDNNLERKSFSCLEQTCSRSLIVFLSQLSVILYKYLDFFWSFHHSKTSEEPIVWMRFLWSAAG